MSMFNGLQPRAILSQVRICVFIILCASIAVVVGSEGLAPGAPYALVVLPREDTAEKDPATGADLLFLTKGGNKDTNLYFHQRSWLSDSSIMLFVSNGAQRGLMGYVIETGEIVRLTAADGSRLGNATAAVSHNSVFSMAGERLLEIQLSLEISGTGADRRARVTARERHLATLPRMDGSLNESCDGKFLAVGRGAEAGRRNTIELIEVASGQTRTLCENPEGTIYHGHVQWSTTNPNWLSFAGAPYRLWVVDIRDGKPWSPYKEMPGELVTHESWWVNDQLIFCGGPHSAPLEESHVKAIDLHTGTVRIVGAGSWWPDAKPAELARRNWWHASASADGRWVAADNWHGDIVLFEGNTTRPRLLAANHRTYGGGSHPEVGWDRKGERVVFASHKLGVVTVCVATIPAAWQAERSRARVGLEAK